MYKISTFWENAMSAVLVARMFDSTASSFAFICLFPAIIPLLQTLPYDDPSGALVYFVKYIGAASFFWVLKGWCYNVLFLPQALDWSKQIVVITGGSSGIGELTANTLANRNINVIVLDINPIQTENSNIMYYECDVSKWEEVERVSRVIIEEIGYPTILINNAGVAQGKLLLDLTPEDVQETFGTNTLAHFWTLKAFLPGMIEQKSGHIVTVGSVAGVVGIVKLSDYCASNAALTSLHESLRNELDIRYECKNIRTTLVLPGHVKTPLFSRVSLPSSALYNFFFPSLQPVDITKVIIASLDDRNMEPRTICIPFYVSLASVFKFMPSGIQVLGRYFSGVDQVMEGFVKMSGIRGGRAN